MNGNSVVSESELTAAASGELETICYREIGPHIEAYKATPDLESALPLMEPHHYHHFADVVARQAASWTTDSMRGAWMQIVPERLQSSPELAHLRISATVVASTERRLAQHFDELRHGLARLDQELAGFKQNLLGAGERAESRTNSVAIAAGALGSLALGPLGAMAAGAAAGYFMGKSVEKEVEAAAEALQQSFLALLGLWDVACERIVHDAPALAASYFEQLLAETSAAQRAHDHDYDGRQAQSRVDVTRGRREALPPARRQSLGRWLLLGVVVVGGAIGGWMLLSQRGVVRPLGAIATEAVPAEVGPGATPVPPSPSVEATAGTASKGSRLYQGPAESFKVLQRLGAPTSVLIVDSSVPGWVKVRLDSGLEGWTKAQAIRRP